MGIEDIRESPLALLKRLRRSRACRGGRMRMAKGTKPYTGVIIGIGQMHTVLTGRFSRRQARKIAKIQTWIFHLCAFLHSEAGVTSFGQEGLSLSGNGREEARITDAMLEPLKHQDPEYAIRHAADAWRAALRKGDLDNAARESLFVNALTLMQAMSPSVTVFPIEQADVHGAVGAGIEELHKQIERIESSTVYRSAAAKRGKHLTPEEAEAAKLRNDLVQAYNKTIAHPERDRSILREVLEQAEKKPVTVFILGEAHRKGMLKLAKKHLPEGMVFAWITPPQLWRWKAWISRLGWLLFLGVVTIGAMAAFG